MNCEECKLQMGAFMDNDLAQAEAEKVRLHLAECSPCSLVCEELSSILYACEEADVDEIAPLNSQALWCRINNVIEGEIQASQKAPVEEPRKGRFLQFSFMQLSAAVVCIAVMSSLLTFVAVRNYTQPASDDFTTRSASTQTTVEKLLSRVGLIQTPHESRMARLKEQQAAIDYWNARVDARRAQWNRSTREAFDKNLAVIDESVQDYTMILQKDPDDELSGEMLDAVMTEKMNLLRDFADL